MPSERFEPAIPAIRQLETHVLDRTAVGNSSFQVHHCSGKHHNPDSGKGTVYKCKIRNDHAAKTFLTNMAGITAAN